MKPLHFAHSRRCPGGDVEQPTTITFLHTRKQLFILGMLCLPVFCFSQTLPVQERSRNAVYGGYEYWIDAAPHVFSVYYERSFKVFNKAPFFSLGLRSGMLATSTNITSWLQDEPPFIPLHGVVLMGTKSHHADFSAGALWIPGYTVLPQAEAGYRYQAPQGGPMARVFIGYNLAVTTIGISAGWAF